MIGTLAAFALIAQTPAPTAAATSLLRVYKKGEILKYQVRGLMVTETQQIGRPYLQPQDQEINYDSTLEVKELKPDGFADVVYKRPTIEVIMGETAESDRRSSKEKVNFHLLLTMSPINHVTGAKDLTVKPPAKPPAKPGSKPLLAASSMPFAALAGASVGQFSIPFIQDLMRVSLYVGTLDTAIDLNPPLPYDDVKPGATWKKTATYQPQEVKGGSGKVQVQRLDWTYTYDGIKEANGRKVHRITGVLKMDTDVAKMVNEQAGSAIRSGIEALPVKMDMKVEYDLDPVTRHTLAARSESKGAWSLKAVGAPEIVLEQKFTGRTTLALVK